MITVTVVLATLGPRRLYSIKLKKSYAHTERITKSSNKFMIGTLKIPETFQGTFNLNRVV